MVYLAQDREQPRQGGGQQQTFQDKGLNSLHSSSLWSLRSHPDQILIPIKLVQPLYPTDFANL